MSMPFLSSAVAGKPLRPLFNLGSMFDIQTGSFEYGKYGDAILSGGLANVTGICGRGNSFKTVIMLYMFLTILDRYLSGGMFYDTEISMQLKRIRNLSKRLINHMLNFNFNNPEKFILTDRTKYDGTAWFEWLKEVTAYRQKMYKKDMATTPFLDHIGQSIEVLIPFVVAVDSLSEYTTKNVDTIHENEIGSSERNMEALREAHAKSQLIRELPVLTDTNGILFMTSIHMGDQHQLDPYAPLQKKLAFMKNKLQFKNVPEKVTFLMHNVWNIMGAAPLVNPKTRMVVYPRDSNDHRKDETDLVLLSVTNLRGKSGISGFPFDLIVSQKDGLETGLTDLHYLRENGNFGLQGDDKKYSLDILPDVTLTRTNVRTLLRTEPRLERALEITSQLAQMCNYRTAEAEDVMTTPKELFDGIKAKGYDWDELLNTTRSWWTFDNYDKKHPKKSLTALDLLNMREGVYKPYWQQ